MLKAPLVKFVPGPGLVKLTAGMLSAAATCAMANTGRETRRNLRNWDIKPSLELEQIFHGKLGDREHFAAFHLPIQSGIDSDWEKRSCTELEFERGKFLCKSLHIHSPPVLLLRET